MPYVSNPAGLGVGKRYGPVKLGGVAGVYRGDGSEREYIWELGAGELAAGPHLSLELPAFYRVESIYYEVEVAFVTGAAVNFAIEGGVALTTAIPLDVQAAITSVALTGLTNVTGVVNNTITLTADAEALASATGKARIMVRFKAV